MSREEKEEGKEKKKKNDEKKNFPSNPKQHTQHNVDDHHHFHFFMKKHFRNERGKRERREIFIFEALAATTMLLKFFISMLFYVFLTLKFDSKAHFTCEYIYEENYVKPQHTAKESFREFKSFLSLFHVNFFPFSNNIACRVNRECVAKKITKKNIHRQKYICCLMGWLKQQQKKNGNIPHIIESKTWKLSFVVVHSPLTIVVRRKKKPKQWVTLASCYWFIASTLNSTQLQLKLSFYFFVSRSRSPSRWIHKKKLIYKIIFRWRRNFFVLILEWGIYIFFRFGSSSKSWENYKNFPKKKISLCKRLQRRSKKKPHRIFFISFLSSFLFSPRLR